MLTFDVGTSSVVGTSSGEVESEEDFPHFHFPCLRSLLMILHSALGGDQRGEGKRNDFGPKWAKI